MSLFGFADIVFNKSNSPINGPLSALEGSPFDTTTLRYPIDVGNYDKGHYMVFYVRRQKNSKYKDSQVIDQSLIDKVSVGGKKFQDIPLIDNAASNFGSEILGKINSFAGQSSVLGSVTKAASGIVGGLNNLFGQRPSLIASSPSSSETILQNNIRKITNTSFIQTTELTSDAIALYMPDTLLFQQSQSYSDVQLGSELGGQIAAAASTAKQEGGVAALKAALAKVGLEASGKLFGQQSSAALFAAAGYVQNPMLELIYTSPVFRQFQFDFMFYPRDEREAYEVQKIIEKFRFHQAPETAQAKNFLIPPSQFDIRFYYGGRQNPNIPSIATCVLQSMDVNYAPNGWASYEVPGQSSPDIGKTGMPVAIQMTLQFKETTILTKDNMGGGNMSGGNNVKNGPDPFGGYPSVYGTSEGE